MSKNAASNGNNGKGPEVQEGFQRGPQVETPGFRASKSAAKERKELDKKERAEVEMLAAALAE